jgi:phosphatidylglycerophosphate synthase
MECESPRIVATDQSYLLNAIGSLFEATRQVPLVILAARSWKQWGGEASALNILSLLPKVRVFEPASVVELQFILERSLRADESTVISLVDAPPLSECEAMDEGAGVWLRRSDARLCVVSFGYATAILVREVGEISDCDHIHFNQLRPHLEPSLIDRLAKYSGVMTLEFNGMLAGFGEALSTQLRVVRHVEHMGINADVQNITFSRQLAFHGFDRSGLIQQINSFRARTEEPHSSTVSAGRYGKISSERQGIDEYLDQFLYRPVATLLVPILARNAVSPMLVTTASFVLGLVSSLAFVVHREPIAGGLLFLSIVLDCADGQLARLLGRTSPEGSALDHVFDDLKIVSISIALAFGFLTSVALHSLLGVVLGGGSLILSLLLGYAFVEGSRNGLPKEIIAADQLARSTRSAWMYGLVTYYRFRLLCVRRIAIAAGIPLDWSDSNPVLQSFTARLPMVYWLSVGPSAVATAFIVCGLFSWTRIFLRSLVFVGPFLLLCGFLLHHAGHWAIKSASERVIDRSKSGVWHP